jgi:hypothetical protein
MLEESNTTIFMKSNWCILFTKKGKYMGSLAWVSWFVTVKVKTFSHGTECCFVKFHALASGKFFLIEGLSPLVEWVHMSNYRGVILLTVAKHIFLNESRYVRLSPINT